MRLDNKYIPAAMKTALTTPGVDLTPVGSRPASPEMYGYLRGAIAQIRWATLGALLIIRYGNYPRLGIGGAVRRL